VAAGPDAGRQAASLSPAHSQVAELTYTQSRLTLESGPNGNPDALRGATVKLFVIAALSAAMWAAPTAAAQSVSASDIDVSAAQNVSVVSPDPAPDPAPTPVAPTPDPVPGPQPATSAPGGETAPPTTEAPPAPAEPAPVAPEPAEPAPAPVAPAEPAPQPEAEPVVQSPPPAASDHQPANSRPDRRGSKPSERRRPTTVDKVKPLPVLSDVAPLAQGLRDRATDAAPPIAVAALALLALALTSGAFLLVATRRTGAWKG
jgi:hypothetical protein